jgi:hypothetical protein
MREPTHEQIAVKAFEIYEMKLNSSWCPPDENTAIINWFEAKQYLTQQNNS